MSEFGATGDGRLDVLEGQAGRDEPAAEAWWPGDCAAGWYRGDEDEYEALDPADQRYDEDAEHASWLTGLPADVRAQYEAGPWTGEGESVPAGFLQAPRAAAGRGSLPAARRMAWTRQGAAGQSFRDFSPRFHREPTGQRSRPLAWHVHQRRWAEVITIGASAASPA